MIRTYNSSDLDEIIHIWLNASVKAHDFIEPSFWESRAGDMREIYIPSSETFVMEVDNKLVGFTSLYKNTLAAIFVAPDQQGKGLGTEMINYAKTLRDHLDLTVYKSNTKSISFYEKHDFRIIKEQMDKHTNHPEVVMKWSTSNFIGQRR